MSEPVIVFHLNKRVRRFPSYDAAAEWRAEQSGWEDYEIVEEHEVTS